MRFAPQRRAIFAHANLQKWSEHGVFCHFDLMLRATAACNFSTSQLPKVVRTRFLFFFIFKFLTYKCASPPSGVPFAPPQRAIFPHLNFQKWSVGGVFTFLLANVPRTTAACSTSELPKLVRGWCLLCILTCKCASRHSGVQFFISPLATWLRALPFSEPTFRPSQPTNHWKNIMIRDFPNFSLLSTDSTFFWLCFSALLFIFPYCRKLDF